MSAPLATVKELLMEEEAVDTKPPYWVARPVKAELEEADKPPWTVKLPATEEEAVAIKPPRVSRVNKVVEAEFWTIKAAMSLLAELVAVRRVRMVEEAAVLEVAATVATLKAGYVVEPTTKLSVKVVSWIKVPE